MLQSTVSMWLALMDPIPHGQDLLLIVFPFPIIWHAYLAVLTTLTSIEMNVILYSLFISPLRNLNMACLAVH